MRTVSAALALCLLLLPACSSVAPPGEVVTPAPTKAAAAPETLPAPPLAPPPERLAPAPEPAEGAPPGVEVDNSASPAEASPPPSPPPLKEPNLTEPNLPKPVLPEPVLPEPVLPEPVLPEPVLPEPVLPEPARPDPEVAPFTLEKKLALPPQRPSDFQLVLERAAGGAALEIPVEVADRKKEAELSQSAELAGTSISLVRFSPHLMIIEQLVAAPPGQPGFPALSLSVSSDVGDQWQTWLVPGSRLLGRMSLPVALLECLPEPAPGELPGVEQLFKKVQSPEAKIVLEVKKDGRLELFAPVPGREFTLPGSAYKVEVLRYWNCFALDSKTGQPIDQSEQPLNPAVELRVSEGEKTRSAWLFSQYPEFSEATEDDTALLRLVYPVPNHPHQLAAITVVDSASGRPRFYLARGGKVEEGELPQGQPVKRGFLTLLLKERIASAMVSQTVNPDSLAGPAVLLRWRKGAVQGERWIPLSVPEEIRFDDEIFIARLRSGATGAHGTLPPTSGAGGADQPLPAGHPTVRKADEKR